MTQIKVLSLTKNLEKFFMRMEKTIDKKITKGYSKERKFKLKEEKKIWQQRLIIQEQKSDLVRLV